MIDCRMELQDRIWRIRRRRMQALLATADRHLPFGRFACDLNLPCGCDSFYGMGAECWLWVVHGDGCARAGIADLLGLDHDS